MRIANDPQTDEQQHIITTSDYIPDSIAQRQGLLDVGLLVGGETGEELADLTLGIILIWFY